MHVNQPTHALPRLKSQRKRWRIYRRKLTPNSANKKNFIEESWLNLVLYELRALSFAVFAGKEKNVPKESIGTYAHPEPSNLNAFI